MPALTVVAAWRFAAGVFAAACLHACATPAAQRRDADPDEVEFAGIAYSAPQSPHLGPPQKPPPPEALPPPMLPADAAGMPPDELAKRIANAAVRDEEQDLLARQYYAVLEVLLRNAPSRGGSAESYDPLPLFRLHAELEPQFQVMREKAQLLDARWIEVAEELGIALNGPLDEAGTAGRLRVRERLCRCVDSDAHARLDHAASYRSQLRKGRSEAEIAQDSPGMQFVRDVRLMSRAMECGRLALRVLRGH